MTPAQNDAVFRESLPEESVECFLSGDVAAPPDWAEQHDHYLYGTPKREALDHRS